ncbi:hypothetical protein Tco_0959268 [Tanacetum coccineum]
MFMGCCLTSWFLKKQTALAISTTKAEYISARKACQQTLWMKQALIDYDVRLDDVPIMFDNKGAIDLSKNPVKHSRTKHIKIRHHFLRDNVQKGHISIEKVPSVDNTADILTKPLKRESFNYLRNHASSCVFTDRWTLDELAYGIPSGGPYQTNLPSIKDIISSIRIDRDGQVRRIHHEEEIDVLEYQNIKAVKDVIENELHLIPEIVNNNLGEVGGVENKSSLGSMLMANGEECLDGCFRAGGGEVMGGGVDFGVSRSLLGEILREIMGDKVGEEYGREEFRVDGGAVW